MRKKKTVVRLVIWGLPIAMLAVLVYAIMEIGLYEPLAKFRMEVTPLFRQTDTPRSHFPPTPVPGAEAVPMTVTVRLGLGQDRGQLIGSLFSITDADGQYIMGAGFSNAYSIVESGSNRQLNVYFKQSEDTTLDWHSKPFADSPSAMLLTNDDQLYARKGFTTDTLLALGADGTWRPAEGFDGGTDVISMQNIDNRKLIVHADRVTYDGRVIFEKDPARNDFNGYYVDGRFYFQEGMDPAYLLVCLWTPQDQAPIERSACEEYRLDPQSRPNVTYLFGSYHGEVIIGQSNGNVFRYANGQFDHIRKVSNERFQPYSIVNWYDLLLIGAHPEGTIFVYDGERLKRLDPHIPVPQQAVARDREAQTIAIYRGDLYVGVWPWGEIWRLQHPAAEWEYIGRAFQTPEITRSPDQPGDNAVRALGLDIDSDSWGQRIHSLVPFQDALYVATMNKFEQQYDESWGFLTPDDLAQYGAVLTLRADANVACDFTWKPETTLRFEFVPAQIGVFQDGEQLCTLPLAEGQLSRLDASRIVNGFGAYGEYGGAAIDVTVE